MRSRGFLGSWSPLFLSHGGEPNLAIESTNNKAPRIRVNRQIRISPIRVIAPDGEQLGVLSIEEAIAAAQERGLDLVEVAPLARPPVAKIMDYGKFKFEQAKAARAAKKKQRSEEHTSELQSLAYLVCRLLLEKKKKKRRRALERKMRYRTSRRVEGVMQSVAGTNS